MADRWRGLAAALRAAHLDGWREGREAAAADDRDLSSWARRVLDRAAEAELGRRS